MAWHGTGVTDVGRVRLTNQDAFRVSNELGLWIVADGMGGHAGGDVASHVAVETIDDYVRMHRGQSRAYEAKEIHELLRSAVNHANATIRNHAKTHPALTGMGTTVVLIFIPPTSSGVAWIAHVGDSRAYLIRERHLSALTRDHTVLEERIRAGLLPQSTSSGHRTVHVLARAVGVEPVVEADVSNVELQPGDELLLCSDGLNKTLNDAHVLDALMRMDGHPPEKKCTALIDYVNKLGGKDNTTVVLIYDEHARVEPQQVFSGNPAIT